MRVAIAQVDGKWPNLALAKVAAWHRWLGDGVEWFMPMRQYDRIYASKVFSDTVDDLYLPPGTVCGGSGYTLDVTLSPDVESTKPDWSLWPGWTYDIGYSTRGCVRRCPFCIVPKKEGKFRVVAEFGDLTTGRDTLMLHDNNLTAAPMEHIRQLASDALAAGVTLNPHQGLDARLLTDEHAAIFAAKPFTKRLHIAFDNPCDEADVRRAISLFKATGMDLSHRLMVFVLVGFDTTPEEDMYRIETVSGLGANPFVMPYDRSDRYQRRLARWCNSITARKSCTFEAFIDNTRRVKVPSP